MAGGVDVSIGSDTREFDRGVKSGMVEPVEDAQRALEEYARTASEAGDTAGDVFRRQQRQTDDLRGDIDRLNRSIRDSSGPTYRRAGDDAERFSKRTTEGFDEIKDSARQNAIETAASFDGSFAGISGGLQGLLSEFLAGFGPAGIVAGLLAASGLGLLTNAIEGGTEAAEDQKAAVGELAGEYIAAGRSGKRAFDDVAAAITAMATSNGQDVAITLQEAYRAAKDAGADYQQTVQSIARASPAELQRVIDQVETLQRKHLDDAQAARLQGRLMEESSDKGTFGAGVLLQALRKTRDTADKAAEAQRLAAEAGLSKFQLKADLIKQVGDAYDDTASDVAGYLNKEKDTLKVGPYLAAVEKKREALIKYREALAESDLSPAARKFIESQGADMAAAMISGYATASKSEQRKLNEVWSTAGDESADSYDAALGSSLSKIKPKAPKIPAPVVPAPDDSALRRYLLQAQPRIKIGVDLIGRNGQRVG